MTVFVGILPAREPVEGCCEATFPPTARDVAISFNDLHRRDRGCSNSGKVHWALNAFFVSLAMFVALFGKLSDRFGARRLFLWGTVIFALSSVGCAAAPAIEILIGMRFVKGLAASMMLATYLQPAYWLPMWASVSLKLLPYKM